MAKNADWLFENIQSKNIAENLDENMIAQMARRAMVGYEIDVLSRAEWVEKAEMGLKIAKQIMEAKTYPWDGAANVKFPMIATAAIQFAARAYPNVVNGPLLVKAKIVGKDPDGTKAARAKRVVQHMSYQLLDGMQEWDEDTDKLLHGLPVFGTFFRKTYFDTLLQSNRSITVSPLNLVINQDVKSLDTCRRASELVPLYKNEVIERERSGVFLDRGADYFESSPDEDAQEMFIEQHCWYDLDEDGYEEPYIVTIHEKSQTLVRIVARYDETGLDIDNKGRIRRIAPVGYYTKFDFIPDPEGKFYSLGFAHLLGPINESINTLINQLLDAGAMSNLQGGFLGKGIRFQGGAIRFKPGEWKPVEVTGGVLRDNIFPLPVKDPSQVLFSLLGLLNDTGMKLASVSEAMTGETPSQNTPATTTLALIEQGMKVFTAIYKRIFRSLKAEFKKLYRLNSIYMEEEEYYRILDDEYRAFREDYDLHDLDIVPVADPNLSSEAQKLARAQAIFGTIDQNPTPQGRIEILRQYYEAIEVEFIEKLLPQEAIDKILNAPPPPDPKMIETELKAVKQQHDYTLEKAETDAKIAHIMAQIDQLKAQTQKTLAEAAAVPVTNQLNVLKDYVSALHSDTKLELERIKAQGGTNVSGIGGNGQPGGTPGMGNPPNNDQDLPVFGGDQGSVPTGDLGGTNLETQLDGGNGPADYVAAGEDLRDQFNAGTEATT